MVKHLQKTAGAFFTLGEIRAFFMPILKKGGCHGKFTIDSGNDMYAESGNDDYKGYKKLATQEDFDRF